MKAWLLLLFAIPASGVMVFPSFSAVDSIQTENREKLARRRDEIRTWVQYCDGAMDYGEGCNQGDLTLFAGLLCLSGETERCNDVRRSQAGDGSWCRAPKRLADSGRGQFSRDQAMGLLAYFVATKDRSAAKRWMDWIYHNDRKAPEGLGALGRVLPHALTFYSFCRNDFHSECLVTPPFWALIGRVWNWIGLELTEEMRHSLDRSLDVLMIEDEARFAVRGYEEHLVAVSVLLHRFMGREYQSVARAGKMLAEQHPNNPLFRLAAFGPEDSIAQLVLAQCPRRPGVKSPNDWLPISDELRPAPFTNSMGWDCIFLINLLLRTN